MKISSFLAVFALVGSICISQAEPLPAGGRVFIGPQYWANRLQDWKMLEDGTIQSVSVGRHRTLHLLTHRITDDHARLEMSVELGKSPEQYPGARAGFLVGAGVDDLDYRAAAMVMNAVGPGFGAFGGVENGKLVIRDVEKGVEAWSRNSVSLPATLRLSLSGAPGTKTLVLEAIKDGEVIAKTSFHPLPRESYRGNVALVSHLGLFGFRNWSVEGGSLDVDLSRTMGPVASTQYTLSKGVLKLTAQLMPVAGSDSQNLTLQIRQDGAWADLAHAEVITPGYTAAFRVENWAYKEDVAVRTKYLFGGREYYYQAVIAAEPRGKREIVVAAFSCNHNMQRGLQADGYAWTRDNLWFPHSELIDNVVRHEADILYFAGDQVYENDSPTPADKTGGESSELDYLYKWYIWGWAFRDLTRSRPSIIILDDHDIFQGNLWGESGARMMGKLMAGNSNTPVEGWTNDDKPGYVMPSEWVKMVERTQTSHLPDPYDPTPVKQGIGVYYTAMNYAGIGIAILEDRKFKSGVTGLVPGLEGREDHIKDPAFDVSKLDKAGLTLYGGRQLAFLEDWAADWEDQDMKLILSQSTPANMATHHGWSLTRIYADLDSNGWPQGRRNRSLEVMRKSFAPLIAGDQHLSTLVQHGIDDWGDAIYSFGIPAVANFYPRAWMPEAQGMDRDGKETHFGKHVDGFGNKVTVHAVTNPTALTGVATREPFALHNKMPGYGLVRMDKKLRTYTFESWPRYEDATTGQPYAGWPVTIEQTDNYMGDIAGYLPAINIEGVKAPVLKLYKQNTGDLVYALRLKGASFRPHVFEEGEYQVIIEQDGVVKTLDNLKIEEGKREVWIP